MAARLDTVCKYICEQSGWSVTNLQLQKLVYMAQMVHMGLNDGARLTDTSFEAWDYGPVSPNLYHKVKAFGSQPIRDIFFDARRFKDDDDRKILLDDVCKDLLSLRPSELVNITHWEQGAWARNYVQGAKGVVIPDRDILKEYRDRVEQFGHKPS